MQVIVHRTESDRAAYGIRLGGVRKPMVEVQNSVASSATIVLRTA